MTIDLKAAKSLSALSKVQINKANKEAHLDFRSPAVHSSPLRRASQLLALD